MSINRKQTSISLVTARTYYYDKDYIRAMAILILIKIDNSDNRRDKSFDTEGHR